MILVTEFIVAYVVEIVLYARVHVSAHVSAPRWMEAPRPSHQINSDKELIVCKPKKNAPLDPRL